MRFGIIRVPKKSANIVIQLAKNLVVNQSIPIYTRSMLGLGVITEEGHLVELAIADMTQHQADCMNDLGYDTRITTLSRKERTKRFNKLKAKKKCRKKKRQ